jgi:mevalonate kinase
VNEVSAFSPGKVILLGEHGVVYGHPAIAAALSRGVTARAVPSERPALKLDGVLSRAAAKSLRQAFAEALRLTGSPAVEVRLSSELPLSMGLGSSGAVSVALARLLLAHQNPPTKLYTAAGARRTEEVALAMEKVFHGRPSGLDHTTSARGGLLWFKAGKARRLETPVSVPLVVCLSGTRPPTKTLVEGLRERQDRWPGSYRNVFRHIADVVIEGAEALQRGDLDALGDAMNRNHGLLSALQVSGPSVESLVHQLRALGALGAKLTGAGGDGGAVIGLFRNAHGAVRALRRQGVNCFASELSPTSRGLT